MASAEGGNRAQGAVGGTSSMACGQSPGPWRGRKWRRDSAWGELPPAWLGTLDSLLPQGAGRGAGGRH